MVISSEIAYTTDMDIVTKGKPQETESLLIEAQKNAIRTNYI